MFWLVIIPLLHAPSIGEVVNETLILLLGYYDYETKRGGFRGILK